MEDKNDNLMEYDYDLHMYKLLTDAINHVDSTDLAVDQEMIFRMIRNDFYSECLTKSRQRDMYLYYLSRPEHRRNILEAMTMMYEDIVINRTTPGLAYSNQDTSLVSPRVRKFMTATQLATQQNIWYHSFLTAEKGVDW